MRRCTGEHTVTRDIVTLSRMCRRAEFEIMGPGVALDIQDTGGSYVDDSPAMVELSIQSADAVILGKPYPLAFRQISFYERHNLKFPE